MVNNRLNLRSRKASKLIKESAVMGQPSPTNQTTPPPTGGDIKKDIEGTLGDSITATKSDLEKAKLKKDEISKVLSVTKNSKKRNYLSDQQKEIDDDLKTKTNLLKNQESSLNKEKEQKDTGNSVLSSQEKTADILNMHEMKTLRKKISEAIQNSMMPQHDKTPAAPPVEQTIVKKDFKVVFDKSTKNPWTVLFSERGFLVDGTRLSFENVEMAIHKNYNIALNGGQGMVLDQIKLNKILKYKDKQV